MNNRAQIFFCHVNSKCLVADSKCCPTLHRPADYMLSCPLGPLSLFRRVLHKLIPQSSVQAWILCFSVLNAFNVQNLFVLNWLVGCFGQYAFLRQYFSLYQTVSRIERETEKGSRNIKTTTSVPTASRVGPCLAISQISRTPRHWQFPANLPTS